MAVDVEDDTGISAGVDTWNGNTGWENLWSKLVTIYWTRNTTTYRGTATDDLDLNTSHVQLSTTSRVGSESNIGFVVGNDLVTEKVLARGQRSWESDLVNTLVGDELVNSPFTSRVSILSDLDPDISSTVGCSWGKVSDDGTLMGLQTSLVQILREKAPM